MPCITFSLLVLLSLCRFIHRFQSFDNNTKTWLMATGWGTTKTQCNFSPSNNTFTIHSQSIERIHWLDFQQIYIHLENFAIFTITRKCLVCASILNMRWTAGRAAMSAIQCFNLVSSTIFCCCWFFYVLWFLFSLSFSLFLNTNSKAAAIQSVV